VVTFSKVQEKELIGKRILVVDDSNVMRKIVANALEKLGVNVEQARDGKEAIEKYDKFKPDLTIMDLVMPEMGGLDAIYEIQKSDSEAKFVVLTSSSRKDEMVTAETLKVLAYVIKPLKIEKFITTIKNIFEQQ